MTNATPPPAARTVVCTITDHAYAPGTAALINSLFASGFAGTIAVYNQSSRSLYWHDQVDRLNDRIKIEILTEFSDIHPFLAKAEVILDAARRFNADSIYFFDSDVLVTYPWEFYLNWVRQGVALCQDIYFLGMDQSHPIRSYWRNLARSAGYEPVRDVVGYANSGFIGLTREHLGLLEAWRALNNARVTQVGRSQAASRSEIGFQAPDQDTLNAALMITAVPLSLACQEGMSFDGRIGYMIHAIGPRKPWHRRYVRDVVVRGVRLPLWARVFWNHASHPLTVASRHQVRLARMEMDMAALLSRVLNAG